MKLEQFEETLRQFLRREPFEPFIVERLDGTSLKVEHPGLAFGGGAASYFASNLELVEITCEEVQAIHEASRLGAS